MPRILRFILPLLILLAAAAGVRAMKAMAPQAERSAPPPRVARVSVLEVAPVDTPAMVSVTGAVEAARQVVVMPEVAGRIVEQSPELVPGGRVAKGDLLVRIDPREFQLAVEQEKSRVRQAELELELEQGRQGVAAKEWAAVNAEGEGAPLALRKPQLATAERNYEAAKAGLARAQLALERSTLRAPFNAIVVEEAAEVGQVVGAQTRIATLVGTDEAFVRASVPVDRLPYIELPSAGRPGSPATVLHDLGAGNTVVRQAQVLRLVGTLDPQSRTAQVMLGVDAPLDLPAGRPPLLPGSYVDILIEGKVVEQVVPIPRSSVVDGDSTWVVTPEGTLASRSLTIEWRDPKQLFVRTGLTAGDRVVTSPLALPIEGMPVEVVTDADRVQVEGGVKIGARPDGTGEVVQ